MTYHAVYFSPTGSTEKIVNNIMEELSESAHKIDITMPSSKLNALQFNEDDFVLVGIPVYSGRVPRLAKTTIERMKGKGTAVALVASYGNRHFDDSLLELKTMLEANGFLVIAAAAFVTEHSVVRKFGAGRPDGEDIQEIDNFAEKLKNKLKQWDKESHEPIKVDGNPSYREYKSIPIKPHASSLCNQCGLCAKSCPAGAIPADKPQRTDKTLCVTCMRCISLCPQKARGFYWIQKVLAEKSIAKLCQGRKENKLFF